MATGNATLRALLVVTLVSFLLFQGVAGEFQCCFCNCYNKCKRNRPDLSKENCHWLCFNRKDCSFSCKNIGYCRLSSSGGDLASPDVGVAIASGGGSLGMVNGTGEGDAPSEQESAWRMKIW